MTKQWIFSLFDTRQKTLVALARSPFTSWLFGLHRLPKPLKGHKIAKITPSSIHWLRDDGMIESAHFTRPRFAEALVENRKWLALPLLKFTPLAPLAPFGAFVFATSTNFFAGAGDGSVYAGGSVDFATTRALVTGTTVFQTDDRMTQSRNGAGANTFRLCRGAFPIDTSAIGSGSTISSASLNLYVDLLYQANAGYTISLVGSTQASTSTLATSDFSKLYGTLDSDTKFNSTDLVSTTMTLNAYNTFDLNAAGLAAINKTAYSKFAVRDSYDIGNSPAASGSANERQVNIRYSQYAGTGSDPYLTVVYSTGSTDPIKKTQGGGVSSGGVMGW